MRAATRSLGLTRQAAAGSTAKRKGLGSQFCITATVALATRALASLGCISRSS